MIFSFCPKQRFKSASWIMNEQTLKEKKGNRIYLRKIFLREIERLHGPSRCEGQSQWHVLQLRQHLQRPSWYFLDMILYILDGQLSVESSDPWHPFSQGWMLLDKVRLSDAARCTVDNKQCGISIFSSNSGVLSSISAIFYLYLQHCNRYTT